MSINAKYYNSSTVDPNGLSSNVNAGYLDRTLAHEMTHAVMAANIHYYANLPQIIREGLAELTHGIDDERYGDITKLAGNATLLSNSLRLSTAYNSVSGINAPDYSGGYMLLRYFAYQVAHSNSPFTNVADTYSNAAQNTVLSAFAGNDSIKNTGRYVTIQAGEG